MNHYQDIIIPPIVTEKSMSMMDERKYTFKVDKRANKFQIKDAIEKLFDGVKVENISTMNISGKKVRSGAKIGKHPDWKKAIVTLTEDSNEIEFFEGM